MIDKYDYADLQFAFVPGRTQMAAVLKNDTIAHCTSHGIKGRFIPRDTAACTFPEGETLCQITAEESWYTGTKMCQYR